MPGGRLRQVVMWRNLVAAIFACANSGKCINLSKMRIIMIEQANPNFIDDYFIQLRITQEFA